MKVVVLGAGALGSVLAGHLARAGEDVMLVARGERAQYSKKHGLTITGLVDFTVPCPVVTDVKSISHADVLIATVKTYDTESALAGISDLAVSDPCRGRSADSDHRMVKIRRMGGLDGRTRSHQA